MPINFFNDRCSEATNVSLFGLCDDPPPSATPAYINLDAVNRPEWIAEVDNSNHIDVTFIAIDNCIEVKRTDGTDEQRCEGFLTYNNTIIFVELKNRAAKGWITKGRDQLLKTIELFCENHDMVAYESKRAHIANKQRPFFDKGFQQTINSFKVDTGFTLQIQTKIEIL